MALAQPPAADLRVRVSDPLGDPIAGASAVVDTDGRGSGRAVITGPDGVAVVPVPELPMPLLLRVSAPGFAEHLENLQPGSAAFDVQLAPAARTEQVTVTAGRRPVRGAELPADSTVISRRDLEVAAAGTIDDVLRLTPGFSLFRRSPSRTANPTTQGVTLRGLSASGASRTLVLADGVPLNDPFGGWVTWDRVPQVAIDRVEVVRGGASDLYGADAAGGVIQVLSVDPASPVVRALVEGGTQESGRMSALAGTRRGPWSGVITGEWNSTEGAIPIAPEIRGPIDTPAGVESTRALAQRRGQHHAHRGAPRCGPRSTTRTGPTARPCRTTTPTSARRASTSAAAGPGVTCAFAASRPARGTTRRSRRSTPRALPRP